MIYPPFTTDLQALAAMAINAMFNIEPVCMTLPDNWKRPHNFPLPIVVHKRTNNREYRPLAVLEWINDELTGENRAAEAKARAREMEKAKC